jgi:hypothetical protein
LLGNTDRGTAASAARQAGQRTTQGGFRRTERKNMGPAPLRWGATPESIAPTPVFLRHPGLDERAGSATASEALPSAPVHPRAVARAWLLGEEKIAKTIAWSARAHESKAVEGRRQVVLVVHCILRSGVCRWPSFGPMSFRSALHTYGMWVHYFAHLKACALRLPRWYLGVAFGEQVMTARGRRTTDAMTRVSRRGHTSGSISATQARLD